ncbi:MAG: restriction endonuclease subunit S [Campylobacterota bacterium]|nr:restriction endonuclease subunit S [Campylobacterota bacterium]
MSDLVKISDIFDVQYGINLELINMLKCTNKDYNSIPFVSRTENNNGVSAFVEKEIDIEPNQAHTLSVAGGGSVLSTFYQPLEYYSGRDIYILLPREKLSIIEMLYYAKIISLNKYRYNYGRQANKTLKDILIPKYISNEMKSKLSIFYNDTLNIISKKSLNSESIDLNINNWQNFKLTDLFEIKGTKTTPLWELEDYGEGIYPYVTTQATNNGIDGFYNYYTEKGNILTVDSAVLGYCSYQELSFSASDHVEKLIPNFKLNRYIALFLTTIINTEQYRYNYGRKCSQTRMKTISIKLPSKNNKPDFTYMENYIKSLEYSASLDNSDNKS